MAGFRTLDQADLANKRVLLRVDLNLRWDDGESVRVEQYRDDETLWRDTVARAPDSAYAQASLATVLYEQGRREQSDLGIGRQQPDGKRRYPHHQQRGHQRRLAPDSITEVPEQHRPDRPGHERQTERRQRREQCGGWTAPGKEQLREHRHRSGGVDVEVVELDRGADHRCHRDAAARDVDDEVVGNRTHQ